MIFPILVIDLANCGFISGRSCGTLNPITVVDNIEELSQELEAVPACVLVKDRESFAQLKNKEASKFGF